jgi:hypothetical protein
MACERGGQRRVAVEADGVIISGLPRFGVGRKLTWLADLEGWPVAAQAWWWWRGVGGEAGRRWRRQPGGGRQLVGRVVRWGQATVVVRKGGVEGDRRLVGGGMVARLPPAVGSGGCQRWRVVMTTKFDQRGRRKMSKR